MRVILRLTCLIWSLPALAQTHSFNGSPPLNRLKINSDYGYRIHPVSGKEQFHTGIDLSAHTDTVLAVMDGFVKEAGYNHSLGLYIRIDHGDGIESLYGHLSQYWTITADFVRAGDPIGLSGATGRVTGEHLHFAIKLNNRFINPLRFLQILLGERTAINSTNANHE